MIHVEKTIRNAMALIRSRHSPITDEQAEAAISDALAKTGNPVAVVDALASPWSRKK